MDPNSFLLPPSITNTDGNERSVGYEFEFTGVDMERAAHIVAGLYGGTITTISSYEIEISESRFGTFKLELDAQLLRDKKYETILKSVGLDLTKLKNLESLEGSLKDLASSVVPFEIITPPVPISEMESLNELTRELRKHHVKGTGSSFFYAFGLHLNPEVPDKSPESLLNHLRAYVMLDPWIRLDADIDISRRLTPYINEYNEKYIQLILNPEYKPDLQTLIRDYFNYDNSRNRPLDMLPLFMHLDEDLTTSLIGETITSARPTYHYRLPNCSLEDERWTLASEWNRWVEVEKLAADEFALNQYSRAWLRMNSQTLIGFEQKWIELINRMIENEK
ncbi:MAG: amidoligase family protein [Balneolaceae bacterium]|nr:amidoligase family protein [Balneolaceae bacterium]MCH8549867.1 amidoligase family protein [Balneolaceae bacterium]